MATGGMGERALGEPLGALGSREDRLALQGVAKRPVLFPERRSSSRHTGGKGTAVAVLPAPLRISGFLPTAGPVLLAAPFSASYYLFSRSSRGPPACLS